MPTKFFAMVSLFVAVLVLSVSVVNAQGPTPRSPRTTLGSEFTYQGQLKNNGTAVNGNCDFQFSLWDASTVGTQVGPTLSQTITVANGLFTTQLDFAFGAPINAVFNGEKRYLDISVRCPSGSGSYTQLGSRQTLTATPYAFYATSTGALQGYPVDTSAPSASGQVLTWNGNAWVPAAVGSGSGGGWSLTGNSGTNPSVNFIGTTDNTAFEVRVKNTRGLRIEPGSINGSPPNMIGGYYENSVTSGIYGATIAGGGSSGSGNQVSNSYGTIGGGNKNTAGFGATIPGGQGNTALGQYSFATGWGNSATGNQSFALGQNTQANHDNTFVWSDGRTFTSTIQNQFIVYAENGFGIDTNNTQRQSLTVAGSVIAGEFWHADTAFVSKGSNSGLKMEDRFGNSNPTWSIYPNAGSLIIRNTNIGEVVQIAPSGKLVFFQK